MNGVLGNKRKLADCVINSITMKSIMTTPLSDGRKLAMLTDSTGKIYKMFSSNGGITWTTPEYVSFNIHSATPEVVEILHYNGIIFALFSSKISRTSGYPLRVLKSVNNGSTWTDFYRESNSIYSNSLNEYSDHKYGHAQMTIYNDKLLVNFNRNYFSDSCNGTDGNGTCTGGYSTSSNYNTNFHRVINIDTGAVLNTSTNGLTGSSYDYYLFKRNDGVLSTIFATSLTYSIRDCTNADGTAWSSQRSYNFTNPVTDVGAANNNIIDRIKFKKTGLFLIAYTSIGKTAPNGTQYRCPIYKVSMDDGLTWGPWIMVEDGTINNKSVTNVVINYEDMVGSQVSLSYTNDAEFGVQDLYLINAPTKPTLDTLSVGTKNFNDVFSIYWSPVSLPSNPAITLTDTNVYYETSYFPDGSFLILNETGLTETSSEFKIVYGGSSLSKIGVRSYIKYNGSKIYSDYSYTNNFTTIAATDLSKLPSVIKFDGTPEAKITIPNKIINSTYWTLEISFKTKTSDYRTIFSTNPNGLFIAVGNKVKVGRINSVQVESTRSGFNDNKFHHIAIKRTSSSNYQLFIDGVLELNWTDSSLATNITNSTETILGTNSLTGITTGTDTWIRPPRYWNTYLSDALIAQYAGNTVESTATNFLESFTLSLLTGELTGIKTPSLKASFGSGASIGFNFTPLEDINIPNELEAFAKENIDFIRTKVNEFRTNNGLENTTWTDPVIVRNVTPVKAVHMNEVQSAIQDVYNNTSQEIQSVTVKNVINQEVKPKSVYFPIWDYNLRIYFILRALRNN